MIVIDLKVDFEIIGIGNLLSGDDLWFYWIGVFEIFCVKLICLEVWLVFMNE